MTPIAETITCAPQSLAYLVTPYFAHPDGIDAAAAAAARIAGALIVTGPQVFAAVPYAHAIALASRGILDPFSDETWAPLRTAMMARCELLIVGRLAGWQTSFGVQRTVAAFEKARKPIWDLEPATMTMQRRAIAPPARRRLADMSIAELELELFYWRAREREARAAGDRVTMMTASNFLSTCDELIAERMLQELQANSEAQP